MGEESIDALNQRTPAEEEQEVDNRSKLLEEEVCCCECLQVLLGIVFYATFFGIVNTMFYYFQFLILRA